MNILDSEEMPEIERRLLALDPVPPYTLLPPEHPAQHKNTAFPVHTPIFSKVELPQVHPLRKLLPNFNNPTTLLEEGPNSTLKLFTYSLLALLFPSPSQTTNESLLETVKCSLYSRDLDFSHCLSPNPQKRTIDNLQGKALLGRFLHTLAVSTEGNQERLKIGARILDGNHLLIDLFIMFFRGILSKLELEGAQEYTYPLPFEETIGNLLEFFDIPHRQLPGLFLMTEERYFLATAQGLFFGEYLQNQTLRGKNELTPNQALTTTQENPSSLPNQTLKKNGVFHNDIKLFNFMLQSHCGSQLNHPSNQKSRQLQTPHFKQSIQFAFGRGRRDQVQIERQEELKREFQKLIMNTEEEETRGVEDGEKEGESPSFPILPAENTFPAAVEIVSPLTEDNKERQEEQDTKPKAFLRKSTFNQSSIADADPISFPRLNPQAQKSPKNIVSVKDKAFTTFSPQPNTTAYHNNNTNFASFANNNQAAFLEADPHGDYFKSSSGKIAEITLPLLAAGAGIGECHCFTLRKNRSKMVSRVCQFMFNPKIASSGGSSRSPRFLHSLKYSQNINNPLLPHPKITVTPPKEPHAPSPLLAHIKQAEPPIMPCCKQPRIPNFLKSLKKDKQKDKYSASSKSKSKKSAKDPTPSPSPGKESKRFELDAQTMQKITKFVKFSAILTPKSPFEQKPSKPKESKSTTRKNQSSSLSRRVATELGGTIKKFDSRFVNVRPGLGGAWKSSSNFHLPQQQQGPGTKKLPHDGTGIVSTSIGLVIGKRQTMRVFPSQSPIPGAFLRASNARPREMQPKQFGVREEGLGRIGSKMAQAHSSEKYKEFTQLVQETPYNTLTPTPSP